MICSVAGIATERADKLIKRTCSRCDEIAGTISFCDAKKSWPSHYLVGSESNENACQPCNDDCYESLFDEAPTCFNAGA